MKTRAREEITCRGGEDERVRGRGGEREGRCCKGEGLEREREGGGETEIVNSMCTTHQSLNKSTVNTREAEAPGDHQPAAFLTSPVKILRMRIHLKARCSFLFYLNKHNDKLQQKWFLNSNH